MITFKIFGLVLAPLWFICKFQIVFIDSRAVCLTFDPFFEFR